MGGTNDVVVALGPVATSHVNPLDEAGSQEELVGI